MVNAKALTLKTVKSQDNCADLGTKTLAAGTLTLLRNLNGLVDKNAMDSVPCGVQAVTISAGESRMLRATALKVLERTLDEIAWNDQVVSRGDRNNMGSLNLNRFIIKCLHPQSRFLWASSLQKNMVHHEFAACLWRLRRSRLAVSLTHARHRTEALQGCRRPPPTVVLQAPSTTLVRFVCVLVDGFRCIRCKCHSQDTDVL